MTIQPQPDLQAGRSVLASWKTTTLASGITSIILGLILIFWPGETLLVIAALLGIGLILLGLSRLFSAFAGGGQRTGSQRAWRGLAGLLYLAAGIVVLVNPRGSLRTFAVIVALIWIIAGVGEVISGFARRGSTARTAPILFGLLNIVFGVVLLVWTKPTVLVIAWIAAIWLIALGLLQVVLSYQLGKAIKEIDDSNVVVIEQRG
jgi:uncharacterized membrane protein HdeD (DUF308 family)